MADRFRRLTCAFLLWVGLFFWPGATQADGAVVRVAAASDLRFVLPAIAQAFSEQTGIDVRLTFGSSGNFTRQIMAGAPFDLFLSADEGYVERLSDAGLTQGSGARYATGRIVLFAPFGSSLTPTEPWEMAVRDMLKREQGERLAIANPEHAPYGRAAAAALKDRSLWQVIKPRLVLGENAAQAAQFAASGSAVGGLIPLSIALSEPFREKGRFVTVPADQHASLDQRMVILKGAAEAAALFYDHLQSPDVRKALGDFGFDVTDGG